MGAGSAGFRSNLLLTAPARARRLLPAQHVSSRVAEAFYWTGRYMERAYNLAMMIGVIESLELEELNPTERTLYRPVWNRILPPLENPGVVTRRNISSPEGTLPPDPRSGRTRLRRPGRRCAAWATRNQSWNALSLEAWSVLGTLRTRFQRARFRPQILGRGSHRLHPPLLRLRR